ncbi:MAG: radical SAM protein, partial [Alphaproteobacteria bacterium]
MMHARTVQGATGPSLTSIYFGGGTPSLMPPGLVAGVIADAADVLGLTDDAEITLEANPTSSEITAFASYAAAGVNRLSLGIQALDDNALNFLGRDHSAVDAVRGLASAGKMFARTTFDLIYGRPGQTVAAWERELGAALAHATGHVSAYQLTVEAGTAFDAARRRGALVMPDDDRLAEFYDVTQSVMEAAGLPAYEVSNHAGAGEQGRHNLTYWRYGAYIGIGPGAHGRLVVD